MKPRRIDELGAVAEVTPLTTGRMSRRQRIERWADLLDTTGKLKALPRIEFLAKPERLLVQVSNSPLQVAFNDPVLRREGLAGDRLGDAAKFFELSDGQAHRMLCNCHYMGSMTGPGLARRLRRLAKGGIGAWFA